MKRVELGRRALIGSAVLALPASALADTRAPAQAKLLEETFLKALPGMRPRLIRYLVANWFVMDQRGVDQGIFTSFMLYEDIDDNSTWDLAMLVGYPQPQGYEHPPTKAAFSAIRRAHREVLIDGRTLNALGEIVGHHRIKPVI